MNTFPELGPFGTLTIGYHFGKPVVINTYMENIKVYDMETLKDISKYTFRNPISKILMPKKKKMLRLTFILLTEDQMAHLLILTERGLSVSSSTGLDQPSSLAYCMLFDKAIHSYLISEKGIVLSVSKPKIGKQELQWPPKTMERIKRFCHTKKFPGQKVLASNSAAFLAFHFMNGNGLISSWIYNFDTKEILNGPFTIQTSPNSFFLSQKYFMSDKKIYSIDPYKEVCTFENPICSSSTYGETVTIANEKGQIFRISENEVKQVGSVLEPVLRVEATDDDFCYILQNGTMKTNSSNAEMNFIPQYNIGYYSGIYVFPGYPNISFKPVSKPTQPLQTSLSYNIDSISATSGAKWNAPSRITSYGFVRVGNDDLFIAATPLTVSIMKCQPNSSSFGILFDKNWDNPVSAVGINSHLYGVADSTNKVVIQNYTGEEYNFTFTSSLCVSLALSETLVASGFADGSVILSSLKDKVSIKTIRPFRIPVSSLTFVSNDKVSAQWSETKMELSQNSLCFTSVPSYSSAIDVAFENGILSLVNANNVEIYSFADKNLLCTIPMKVISIDTCKRRIALLTIKHELILLYFHRSLAVETQALVELSNPISVHICSNAIFVVCKRNVVIFDYSGKKLDTLDFPSQPRCASASDGGLFIGFLRYFWFVAKDQKPKKFSHDKSNLSMLSAVDDNSFVITTSTRAILCKPQSNSYTIISKYEKRVTAMKCIASKEKGQKDKVACFFIDDTMEVWDIPSN